MAQYTDAGRDPSRHPDIQLVETLLSFAERVNSATTKMSGAASSEEFEQQVEILRTEVLQLITPQEAARTEAMLVQIEVALADQQTDDELKDLADLLGAHHANLEGINRQGMREGLTLLGLSDDPTAVCWIALRGTLDHLRSCNAISGLEFAKEEAAKSFNGFLDRCIDLHGTSSTDFISQIKLIATLQRERIQSPEDDAEAKGVAAAQVCRTSRASLINGLHRELDTVIGERTFAELRKFVIPGWIRGEDEDPFERVRRLSVERYRESQAADDPENRRILRERRAASYEYSPFTLNLARLAETARHAPPLSEVPQYGEHLAGVASDLEINGHLNAERAFRLLSASARLSDAQFTETRLLLKLLPPSNYELISSFLERRYGAEKAAGAIEVDRIVNAGDLSLESVLTLRDHIEFVTDDDRIRLLRHGQRSIEANSRDALQNIEDARNYRSQLAQALAFHDPLAYTPDNSLNPFEQVMTSFFASQIEKELSQATTSITADYLQALSQTELDVFERMLRIEIELWFDSECGDQEQSPFRNEKEGFEHLKSLPLWSAVQTLPFAHELSEKYAN